MSVKKTKTAKKSAVSVTAKKSPEKKLAVRSVGLSASAKPVSKSAVQTSSKSKPETSSKKTTEKPLAKSAVKANPVATKTKTLSAKVTMKKSITVASASPAEKLSENKLPLKSIKVTKTPADPVVKVEPVAVQLPKEEYKAGDKVVYPAHGVGLIDSIQARIIGGLETKFYMITILETGMKVMVPMKQAVTVGLRKIVDTKTVEKVYDILRDRDVTVHPQTWNRRHREYTQKLKTGSVFEIASVIRDLSVLKSDKELSFGERKMLDMAQGLLVKEISIAKAKTEDLIKAELQEICDAA